MSPEALGVWENKGLDSQLYAIIRNCRYRNGQYSLPEGRWEGASLSSCSAVYKTAVSYVIYVPLPQIGNNTETTKAQETKLNDSIL